MTTRRELLKGLAAGAAAASVPGTARATTSGAAATIADWADGPAPWWLLSPVGRGQSLGLGWYLYALSEVRRGAATITLRHSTGREARIALSVHDGSPSGLAHTALLDLVLMDGHTGIGATEESLGRVVLGLARNIAKNELSENGDLWPIAKMMTHRQRVSAFGPETL